MSDIAKMIAIAKKFGGSSVPAEVVILPETTLELYPDEPALYIETPLSATPTDGAVAKIVYNGVEYTSPISYGVDNGNDVYMIGNLEPIGMTGGNPDAPFTAMLMPDGADGGAFYGMVMPLDGSTTVTISIVQEGGAAGGVESAGGGVMTARVEASSSKKDMALSGCDKKFGEFMAAYKAGKLIRIIAATEDNGNPVEYVGNVVFYSVMSGVDVFAVAMPYATGTSTKQFMLMAGEGGEAVFPSYDNT